MSNAVIAVINALARRPEILGLVVIAFIDLKAMKQAQGGRRSDHLLWEIGFGILGVATLGLVVKLFF